MAQNNKKSDVKSASGNKNSHIPKVEHPAKFDFAFSRENYIIMFIGLAFLAVGYILMIGGGSDDPNVFNEAVFNFRRLKLSPILLIIGFIIEIYAIMYKSKDKKSGAKDNE